VIRLRNLSNPLLRVYGVDAQGQRVEAYFHPKTLEPAQAQ